MISHGDKFVTSGQIPVEADVSCNVLSSVDSVSGLALAMDGGLKWIIRGYMLLQAVTVIMFYFEGGTKI